MHTLSFSELLAEIREETEQDARFQRRDWCFSGGIGSDVFVAGTAVFEQSVGVCTLADYWYARLSGHYEEAKQRGLVERKAKEEAQICA